MESQQAPKTTRRWSRRQFLYTVPAVALPLIAACSAQVTPTSGTSTSSGSTPAAGTTVSEKPAQTPAKTGGYQGKIVVFGVNATEQGQGKLNEDFQAANPGVTVEYSFMPSAKFVELFTAAQNAGEQIDALILNGQDLRRYATGGQLVDLTKEISNQERFRPIGLKTYTIGGKLWALPYGSVGGFPIFYNKALLDKHGLKYPEAVDDLVAMKGELQKDSVAVFTHSGKEIYLWPVWFFTTYAQTTKNQAIEKTVATLKGEGKFTDPEVVQAIDAIFKIGKDGLFIEGVNSLDIDGSTANFLTGKGMAWLHSNGLIRTVREANPPDMDLDVALAPQVTAEKVQSQFPGGTGAALCVYHKIDESRKPVAFNYLNFLTQDKNVEWLVQQSKGSVATNTNANPSDDPVAVKFGKELVDHLVIYLDWYWPPEITRAFQEQLQAGVGGQTTAEGAGKEIQTTFEKLVANGYSYQD